MKMPQKASKARVGQKEKTKPLTYKKNIQGERIHFIICLSLTQSVLIPPVETGGLRIGLRTDEPSTFLPFQLLGHKRKVPTFCHKAPQNRAWGVQALFGIATGSSEERCVCTRTHLYTKEGVVERGKQRTTTCKIEA
jgi:hypothetical protein